VFHFTIWTSGDRDALELIQRIHTAVQNKDIPEAAIRAMVCDRVKGENSEADDLLKWCDEQALPVVGVSSRRLRRHFPSTWRAELGRRFRRLLSPYPSEIHLLVGYMLWVDDATTAELPMLNLHPALPGGPVGTWQQVIRTIQSQGSEEHGATMQLVRPGRQERDRGFPVAFFRFPVTQSMSFEQIRKAGFRREPILLVETLKALARGELRAGQDPARDLTEKVDNSLRSAS
jgi:phosphoribosylglycinamide formyltransferase-1